MKKSEVKKVKIGTRLYDKIRDLREVVKIDGIAYMCAWVNPETGEVSKGWEMVFADRDFVKDNWEIAEGGGKMTDMTVANTIFKQIGGNQFAVMTGAKNFVADNNSLRMTIGRNASKANRLMIRLNGDDTYTMIFTRYTAGRLNRKTAQWIPEKFAEIAKLEHVYCDQLQELFTRITGMYTHL